MFVRLTPKSSGDALEGIEVTADGRSHLKVRVRAVPEEGKANAALLRPVGKTLGVPTSAVTLASGATARLKTLHIVGQSEMLEAALSRFSDS